MITEQAAADGLTADDLVTQVRESHESDYAAIVANAEAPASDEGGGSPVPSTPATTFSSPTVEELTAAFLEGAKRAGYVPLKTSATSVNNKTDTSSTETTSEESAKTTATEPTVAELTEAFLNGTIRAGYVPSKTSTESTSTIPDTESNKIDMESDTESSVTKSAISKVGNGYEQEKANEHKKSGMAALVGGNGIPMHEEPILLTKIDATDSNAVMEQLRSFEKSAIPESVETACVITKDGKVFKCFGVKDRVFPDSDLGELLVGASVTHNHPISETVFSFSDDDLRT